MTGKKHAYLIIAHSNFYILEKLLLLLDDTRNDIFIHIDLKCDNFDFKYFTNIPQRSNIYFTERNSVIWGNISQIKTELILFKTASSKKKYQYYHLISGVDLPIKSQDYIHHFFDRNNGREFIGYMNCWNKDRVTRLQLFSKNLRDSSKIRKKIFRFFRLSIVYFQKLIRYEYRSDKYYNFKYGHNWVSVTHQFVKDLVAKENEFIEIYKHSNAADEIYKHTFSYNSKYKNQIYDLNDDLNGCMRMIDWKRGQPYIYRESDKNELFNSEKLFARKFDENIDKEIIDYIFNKLYLYK